MTVTYQSQIYQDLTRCQQHLAGIEAIDFYLAKQLSQLLKLSDNPQLNQGDKTQVFHILLALQYFLRQGHTCLPLAQISGQTLWRDETAQLQQVPENKAEPKANTDSNPEANIESELPVLPASGFTFSDQKQLISMIQLCFAETHLSAENLPIILDDGLLYFRRYHQYETLVAAKIRKKSQQKPLSAGQVTAVKAIYPKLFGHHPNHSGETDWQQVAVANALGRELSIICGGPGTGKTYTVARLLAVLQAAKLADENDAHSLNILMAAPTGKAAQRLKESITAAKKQLAQAEINDDILQAIPEQASTLHRLLGITPNHFQPKHNADNPLNCDLLLVDEVSMIDLAMMAKLLAALPQGAALILLGDAQQLPSVETGNVLADLVAGFKPVYPPEAARQISEICHQQVEVADNSDLFPAKRASHICFLTKTHRFGGEIAELAKEIINGEAKASWQRLSRFAYPATQSINQSPALNHLLHSKLDNWLEAACLHYYLPVSQAKSVDNAFNALARFRILVANRQGPFGVEQLNLKIEKILAQSRSQIRLNQHYHGRPIMVTENAYSTGLFNGDIGLIWADENKKLNAYFETENGLKKISLARLPKVETVYAMTIHKTQGSEFSDVALILPTNMSQLLSPELIYTGITRAKQKLFIVTDKMVWHNAVNSQLNRYSGLAKRLFNSVESEVI
ncbi:exodeoxyribonuclease V subunit alpha [Catenovulum sp. 2E275]|uniref:exodeoxyribonuclease V subunit alpha n=1 Tax=Catenovulum sp. 2E275 TaxID=2980497 RepID=UPI0021D258CB|nr:exodeoxyribonuclease V subunit alpha [Catenovulum sp. 2E275]MCU4674602.1 exodeoxyribonuclease V subunit alpha [Catenovulum sp. 2E275]